MPRLPLGQTMGGLDQDWYGNCCRKERDHYNVVADGTMPEAVDVRETNQKLEELVLLLDGKAKWDDAKSSD